MSEHNNQSDREDHRRTSGPDWEDPSVPVGNAPPMPAWHLVLAVVAWIGGLGFLLVMLSDRLS